jgi:hypothetical protein
MSTPRPGRPLIPHWRELYEEAVLEVDTAKIPDRVKDAKEGIQAGIHELSSAGHYEECRPLFDALNVLDDLLRMCTKKPNSAEH